LTHPQRQLRQEFSKAGFGLFIDTDDVDVKVSADFDEDVFNSFIVKEVLPVHYSIAL
jgi:hypothetical protein